MNKQSEITSLKQVFHIGHLQVTAIMLSDFITSDSHAFSLIHNHRYFELRVFSGGDATAYAGDMYYPVHEGDLFITPPLMYHCFISSPTSSYRSFSFDITAEDTPQGADELSCLTKALFAPMVLTEEDHWVDTLLTRISREFDSCKPGYMSHVSALTSSLILTIMRYLLPDKDVQWNSEYSAYDIQQELIIESFFAEQYRKDICINDLANLLHVSTRQVNRILHNLYNCSFTEKLIELRIESVKLAITHGRKGIAEAAFENGFHTMPYFHTAFRDHCGCTPSQYIKHYKEGIPL